MPAAAPCTSPSADVASLPLPPIEARWGRLHNATQLFSCACSSSRLTKGGSGVRGTCWQNSSCRDLPWATVPFICVVGLTLVGPEVKESSLRTKIILHGHGDNQEWFRVRLPEENSFSFPPRMGSLGVHMGAPHLPFHITHHSSTAPTISWSQPGLLSPIYKVTRALATSLLK